MLPETYAMRIASLRSFIDIYDTQVRRLDAHVHSQLKDDRGYHGHLGHPRRGQGAGAILVAEIGDISRFDPPEKLCSWTVPTPQVRADFVRIAERRGNFKARVAVARKLLALVYYGLRGREVRCLDRQEAARAESDTADAARELPWPPVRWRGRVSD